jgi:hypothetical protein
VHAGDTQALVVVRCGEFEIGEVVRVGILAEEGVDQADGLDGALSQDLVVDHHHRRAVLAVEGFFESGPCRADQSGALPEGVHSGQYGVAFGVVDKQLGVLIRVGLVEPFQAVQASAITSGASR